MLSQVGRVGSHYLAVTSRLHGGKIPTLFPGSLLFQGTGRGEALGMRLAKFSVTELRSSISLLSLVIQLYLEIVPVLTNHNINTFSVYISPS